MIFDSIRTSLLIVLKKSTSILRHRTFLLLFILPINVALAGTSSTDIGFARALENEGDFYRAITEYKRVLFFSNPADTRLRVSAIFGIARTFNRGSDHVRAGKYLSDNLEYLFQTSFFHAALETTCQSFIMADIAEDSRKICREYWDTWPGAGYYDSLSKARLGLWREVLEVSDNVKPEDPFFSSSVRLKAVAEEALNAPHKSETLAGVLGIIPGMGYMYSGHKKSALLALLVNVTFTAAAVEAFDNDENILGGMLSLVSLSWYVGSIHGGILSARRFNDHTQSYLWVKIGFTVGAN